MDFEKLEQLFSVTRLSNYLKACRGEHSKAFKLYSYNLEASKALYPLISLLEVAIRNAIDRELAKFFGVNNWLITKKNQFANHHALVYKNNFGKIVSDNFFIEKLNKAELKLKYRRVPVTHGKLLSELTFGFWIKFFDANSIKVLKGAPLQAFANKPSIKLSHIHSHLNAIVNLRNRISHSEPICFNRVGELCLKTIENYEVNICQSLGWIDKELEEFGKSMSDFKPVFYKISSL